jgi:zinc protease
MFKFKIQNSKCRILLCFSLVIFTLNLFTVNLYAQVSANAEAQLKLVTEFDVNGLKVIIKRRASSPTVSANLFFRGGVQNITEKNAGIESLLLSVASEGSKSFPRPLLRKELSRTGSSIGGGSSLDYSVLSLASTRQNFERSWQIFTDIAINPAFSNEDFQRIRSQILTGLQSQNDEPEGYLQVLKNKAVFANHPYANSPNGTAETVNALSINDLTSYHKQMMQTSKMLFVIVGDVDPNDLKMKITKSFGKLPRGNYKQTPLPQIAFTKPTLDITSRELPTNYIQGEFSAPGLDNPDYYAMRVATTILRERIFDEVRVKRNLSYAPNADMNELNANTGNIYVTAVDANKSVGIMLDEIKRIQTETVDERTISGVRGGFLTSYFLGQETNSAQAAEIARYELIGGGWRNSLNFLEEVNKITPEKVKEVSAKYIKNLRFVVLGNPAAVNKEVFLKN